MTFVVQANTPEEFRSELLEWFKKLHIDARDKASTSNQSRRNREAWRTRVQVLEEAAYFIQKLKIEPIPPIPFTDGSLP